MTSSDRRLMKKRDFDARRRASKPWRAWYKLAVWQSIRVTQLANQPLCERCTRHGRTTAATTVHHRKAHKGDWDLFLDTANHESVCDPCHNRDIQSEEVRGYSLEVNAKTGWPTDINHPANREVKWRR